MLENQSIDSPTHGPEPFRYDRREAIALLDEMLHDPDHPSLRAFAEEHDLPESTLRYWQHRREQMVAPGPLRDFLESPVGFDFLQRLTLAAHLSFHQANGVGIRPLMRFFEHAGLAPFLACSYGVHQRIAQTVQDGIVCYGEEQHAKLAAGMPPRKITLCEDEVYLTSAPWLVGMAADSGFLLVECCAARRDEETWNLAVKQGLAGLPVEVVQGTSDMAKGIVAHVTNGLGAHHSPDLMPLQQDLHQATSLPLQRQVKQAQDEAAEAEYQVYLAAAVEIDYEFGPRQSSRRPDFARRMQEKKAARREAQQELLRCQDRQEEVKEAIRGLGDDYHPFDAKTGAAVSAETLKETLETRLEVIQEAADVAELPDKSHQKINRVRKIVPKMVGTLVWFWAQVTTLLAGKTWPKEEKELFEKKVLAWVYWQQASKRGRDAKHRRELRQTAQRCREAVEAHPIWQAMPEERRQAMLALAQECANRWVRSSSCVEGRNAVLRLRHHGRRGFSVKALTALTVLHNYWICRPDETTAAERFFGKKPDDLFEWLLKRFPPLPRPVSSRQQAA
jgi:hypothetical protein